MLSKKKFYENQVSNNIDKDGHFITSTSFLGEEGLALKYTLLARTIIVPENGYYPMGSTHIVPQSNIFMLFYFKF